MFDLRVNALNCIRSSTQCLGRAEKHEIYKELKSCLDIMETVDEKPLDEVVGCESIILTLLITIKYHKSRLLAFKLLV